MDTTESRIISVLDMCRGVWVCVPCLALQSGASFLEAEHVVAGLRGHEGFSLSKGQCADCLRPNIVVAAAVIGEAAVPLKHTVRSRRPHRAIAR
jgi:hypothetical protein